MYICMYQKTGSVAVVDSDCRSVGNTAENSSKGLN